MKKLLITCCLTVLFTIAEAQTFSHQEPVRPEGFGKKILWGFTYTQYWSTISGSALPKSYFAKPSSGLLITGEYYPLSFLSVGLGFGIQQRGAGVTHATLVPNDSSFRERLRFTTFEIPLSIGLRTPKDLLRGVRLSGSAAIVPTMNLHSRDVLNVLEPSVGDTNLSSDVSASYFKKDMVLQFSLGPEIDYGSGVLRVHFAWSQGTTNVYSSGQGTGHNQSVGFKVTALF